MFAQVHGTTCMADPYLSWPAKYCRERAAGYVEGAMNASLREDMVSNEQKEVVLQLLTLNPGYPNDFRTVTNVPFQDKDIKVDSR